jgi:predicted negative regulator of RcsB-dependent stress response
MKNLLFVLAIIITGTSTTTAQVESEAGFMYVKAKYLYDTDRHDDAIREFNKVIKLDPKHEDVLLLRASSKYALAAYRGAETDVLEYIKLKGISPYATLLLGKAQMALDNVDAAAVTLKSAAALAPSDPSPAELLGDIAEEEGELLTACSHYKTASKLGSTTAKNKAIKICADVDEVRPPKPKKEKPMSVGEKLSDKKDRVEDVVKQEKENPIEVVADPDLNTDRPAQKEPILDKNPEETKRLKEAAEAAASGGTTAQSGSTSPTEEIEEVVEEEEEKVEIDDTPRMLDIDEDLTIKIQGQGLGNRDLEDQPNILILSESDGVVAIDVCVSKKGIVTSANYNQKASTLDKKSLISLAIRKSKDFVFGKGTDDQCGTLYYMIKGS